MSQTKEQRAKKVILSCLLEVNDLPEWTVNYERESLYEALSWINNCELEEAVATLGQAVEHAFREKWTETRPEADACKEAFDILTEKTDPAA